MIKADPTALKKWQQSLLVCLSFLIVAFGQPAWVPELGLVTGCIGYALYWRVMFCWPERRFRFLMATAWFAGVQMIHLSWMTADDYQGTYIYGLWLFLSVGMGLQFGLLSLLVRRKNLARLWKIGAICSVWTIMEWSRLFLLTGFSLNPVGLAITGWIYPMQLASIAGVYGLSFFVIFTNLLAVRVWALSDQIRPVYLWIAMTAVPYVFGFCHLTLHEQMAKRGGQGEMHALLVQTATPPAVGGQGVGELPQLNAFQQWVKILELVKEQRGQVVDLVVLPETAAPYPSTMELYPQGGVRAAFIAVFGQEGANALPPLVPSRVLNSGGKPQYVQYVSNRYWAQGLANLFEAELVAGMEDRVEGLDGVQTSYSAALHFSPHQSTQNRYEKRILLPMAEYIPNDWCRSIAAHYGIVDSFAPGTEAKVFTTDRTPPMGFSICYEETYGDLVRESRQLGAELLVNLTNDAWYPFSRLPKQHFDHARLRSVENGVPMLRACNTGITSGIDSLGNIVGMLGDGSKESEWEAGTLHVELPTYHYRTLYSWLGDGLIIGVSFILTGLALRFRSLSL